jgi:multidrug resistance efflux pump
MKFRFLLFVLVAFLLTACGSFAKTPTALPTVVLESNNVSTQVSNSGVSGGVTASGIVIPAAEAQMAFTIGGNVKAVKVAEGDQVKNGQVLVELDDTAAQIEVDQAQRNLNELISPASIAAAEQVVANTQQDLKDAQTKVDGLHYPRASDTLVKNIQGQIDLTKRLVSDTAAAYSHLESRADDDPQKAAALVAKTNAQLKLNQLIARYNWYKGKPSTIDEALTQANLDAAKAAFQEAQWYLAALKGEQIPEEATGSKLTQLENAKDNLELSKKMLENTHLTAPISSRVVSVNVIPGEYVSPGEIIVVVSDINNLQVETTDLSERDISGIKVGQPVTVSIKALNTDVAGVVKEISLLADTLGGDVVYKTKIDLNTQPPDLRAGMSVDVQFNPQP